MTMKYLLLLLIFFPTLVSAKTDPLKYVNQYRTEHGRTVLIENDETCDLAKKRLRETNLSFNHDKFYQRSPELVKVGWWGENLARNFNSKKEVVLAWDKSPVHKRILLLDAKYACLKSNGSNYVLILYLPTPV